MEDVFSLGPAPATRHLVQQLVVNLLENIGRPDIIGFLSCSGGRGGKLPCLQKSQEQKLKH